MKKYLRKSVKLLIALGISIVFILGFNNKNSTAASNTDIRPGYDGQWYYYNDGNIDMSYTGLASNEYGWFYIRNGVIDWSYTGLASNEYGWFYVNGGALDWSYTGLASNEYGWFYVSNGALDWSYTGLASNEYGWFYVNGGVLDWSYTGLASNEYGWFYINGGALDWGYTGLAYNEYGWFYVSNGALDWGYTGLAYNEYGWFYVNNGAIDWSYTGLAYNDNGWFYVSNGAVDWSYTGIASNDNGQWYIEGGQINWGYTGQISFDGRLYDVSGGKATLHIDEAHQHVYRDVVVAPTCTLKGYTEHICDGCGDSYKDSYTKELGHDYKSEITKSPTCTENGVRTYTCNRCNDSYIEPVLKTAHRYEDTVVEPTCTSAGYTKHVCPICGDSYTDNEKAALGHSYTSEVNLEPTCTQNGEKIYTCSRCHNSYTETIAATGHKYVDTVVAPTCISNGYTNHECSVCGESYFDDVKDFLPHSMTTEITEEPTCQKEGSSIDTCSLCGWKRYNTLPKTDHNYVVSRVIEPSCTQEGFTQYACTMCNQSYNTDYTEATGHSYEITRVVKEATCTEEGYIELRCSKCRDFKHENTPKAEHKYTDKVVPPSSKEKGYTLHTCTVCRYSYKDNYTEDYDPHRKVYGDEYDARAIYVEPGDRVVFDLSREYKGYSVGSEYGYKELEAGQEIEITKDYEYKNLQFKASTGSYDSYYCKIFVGNIDKESGFFYFENQDEPGTATIYNYVGDDAEQITSLTVPAQVAGLKVTNVHSTFDTCTSLEELIYSERITDVVFETNNISNFAVPTELQNPSKRIVIPSTVTSGKISSGHSFMDSSRKTREIVFNGTPNIPDGFCSGMENLKKVTLLPGVQTIGESAFAGTGIEEFSLPESVTSIGNYAFANCDNLTEVIIPERVNNIGEGAFSDCENVEKVVWSDKLTEIPKNTFKNCVSLKDINFGNVHSIGTSAFDTCTSLTSVNIPDSVTNIGDHAFSGCSSLVIDKLPTNVTVYDDGVFNECKAFTLSEIPEGVTKIWSGAFAGCEFPDSITLPVSIKVARGLNGCKKLILKEGVTKLDSQIKYCSEVEEVILPETLTEIGNRVFEGCDSLKSITIPKSLELCPGALSVWGPAFEFSSIETVTFEEGTEKIHNALFANCGSLKTVNIPDTVKTIGQYAFIYCENLESVNIPEGVTTLETSCFAHCGNLKSITIPSTIDDVGGAISGSPFEYCGIETVEFTGNRTTIPQSIFYESNNLKHVIFPENLKEIGNTAFYSCDSLETVTFPEGLERIGDGAFAYCPNLTEVTIPNSVTYWGSESASGLGNAFEYSGLKTVHLNEGRAEIPSYAFIHCENLTDINIPSTVEKIGDYAFDYCNSLESIVLPEGLTSLGMAAFANTGSLRSIVLPKSLTNYGWVVGGGPFEYSGLSEVTLEDGTTNIAEGLFTFCKNLSTINIPSSVTTINNYAFYGCESLTSFTIPANVTTLGAQVFYGSGVTEMFIPKTLITAGNNSMSAFEGSNIAKITLEEGITTISTAEFTLCKKLAEVNLPSTLKTIENSAFQGCDALVSITIPYGVTSIEGYAFADCAALEKVVVPSSVTSIATLGSGQHIFAHIQTSGDKYPTMYVKEGSYAHTYAKDNNINYVVADVQ